MQFVQHPPRDLATPPFFKHLGVAALPEIADNRHGRRQNMIADYVQRLLRQIQIDDDPPALLFVAREQSVRHPPASFLPRLFAHRTALPRPRRQAQQFRSNQIPLRPPQERHQAVQRIRRWPPAVYSVGIVPLSHHRLTDDSLTWIAAATCLGVRLMAGGLAILVDLMIPGSSP